MRVAAAQRSVAVTEAGSGTRHGFRAIVRHVIRGSRGSRSSLDGPSLEGDAAAAADRDALDAYVTELHNSQPTDRQQWDARERQARRSSTSIVGSLGMMGSPKASGSHGSNKAEKSSRRHSCSALSPQQLSLSWDTPAVEGLGVGLAAMLPPHDLEASSLDSPPPVEPLRVRRRSSALSLSTSSSAESRPSSLSSPATPRTATATFDTDARGLRKERRRSSVAAVGASNEDSARRFPEVRSPPPEGCSSPEPLGRRSSALRRHRSSTREMRDIRATL